MASAITLFGGIDTKTPGRTSDDLLMLRYARGERGAFDVLYARYKQPLYGYFYRNCPAGIVDELFQDVWLRLIASAQRYENKNRFRSWLFTMAHNCLVDFYRSSKSRAAFGSADEPFDAGNWSDGQLTETPLICAELEAAINGAVNTLPQEQRETFCLREELGFSLKDIAEIQGIPPEAAKSRLRYAYKKLRLLLKQPYLENFYPEAKSQEGKSQEGKSE